MGRPMPRSNGETRYDARGDTDAAGCASEKSLGGGRGSFRLDGSTSFVSFLQRAKKKPARFADRLPYAYEVS